jgi:hypothetical protein
MGEKDEVEVEEGICCSGGWRSFVLLFITIKGL